MVSLLDALLTLPFVNRFYLNTGYIPTDVVHELQSHERFSLLFYSVSPWLVYLLMTVWLVASVLLILGYCGRIMSLLTYVAFLSFKNRYPVPMNGGDAMLGILLFLAMFMELDSYYVLPWIRSRQGKPRENQARIWPVRMVQAQLAIAYFFGFLAKAQTPDWMNGSAMLYILNQTHYATLSFVWLSHLPILANLLTYFPIVCELCFPFLVWFRQTRLYVLAGAFLLHLGILLAMNVGMFSEVMWVGLILFLSDEEVERAATWFKPLFRGSKT